MIFVKLSGFFCGLRGHSLYDSDGVVGNTTRFAEVDYGSMLFVFAQAKVRM